jgi:hypothetical protein
VENNGYQMAIKNETDKETGNKTTISARQRAWNSMRIFRTFTDGDIEATAEIGVSNLRNFISLLLSCGYLRKIGKTSGIGDRRNPKIDVYILLIDSGPRTPQFVKPTDKDKQEDPSRAKGLKDPNNGEVIWLTSRPTAKRGTAKPVSRNNGPTARQRAWTAMRGMRTFTEADLKKAASVGVRNLRGFISLLLLCGYLEAKEESRANESKSNRYHRDTSREVYTLVNNSGPLAPRQLKPTAAEKRKSPLLLNGILDQNTGVETWPERKPTVKELMNGVVRTA